MSRYQLWSARVVGLVALATSAACSGSDPLSVSSESTSVRAREDEVTLAKLATSSQVGGTRPSLASLPRATDTLAVGDSVQYVPTGSLIRKGVRQFWYSTDPANLTVTQNGWVKAVAVGTATAIMVPQTEPFPTAFTVVTVVERPAAPPVTAPVVPVPPPTAPVEPPPAPPSGSIGVMPELPRSVPSTAMPVQTGRTISVPAGGDLQAALNTAQPGDVVSLAPGATYTGSFTLPLKAGSGWIVVRTGVPDAALPAPGTRMTPARAASANLAKIVSSGRGAPALQTQPGAARWWLMGLEVTAQEGAAVYSLVALGTAGSEQDTEAEIPRHFVLDRVWIHGTPTLNFQRCLMLNTGESAVVNSYLSDCHGRGMDSQAIAGWNGPGPYLIENNYLDGAGENVMFGGSEPSIANLVPSDITIRRNYFHKPVTWKGVWTVKNSFELKAGRRVLVERNVFDGSWTDGQTGYAWVLKGADGPTEDITLRSNHVYNAGAGVLFEGKAAPNVLRRVRLEHNLFERINVPGSAYSGAGRLMQFTDYLGVAAADIAIVRNSFGATGTQQDYGDGIHQFMYLAGAPISGLTVAQNVAVAGHYGVFGDGVGMGNVALARYAPNAVFLANALVGIGNRGAYPQGTVFLDSPTLTWIDPASGNWMLRAVLSTPLGADLNSVRSSVSGVTSN